MRILSFLSFFGILTGVIALGHWYLWARLVKAPGWPAPWTRIGSVAIVALALLIPLAMPLVRSLPRSVAGPLAMVAYAWMGIGFFLTLATFVSDLVVWIGTGILAWPQSPRAADPERRRLLVRAASGLAAFAAFGIGALGMRNAREVAVKEVRVRLARLPKALSGFSIVQLSDIHVGPTIGRSFVERIVERTNALRPDVVAITGDLVDGSVEELAEHVAPLAELRAPRGVYFVTGNHEYYSGADAWIAHLRTLGIRVLRNERVAIGDGKAGFDLAGIDDHQGARFGNGHGPDSSRGRCKGATPGARWFSSPTSRRRSTRRPGWTWDWCSPATPTVDSSPPSTGWSTWCSPT